MKIQVEKENGLNKIGHYVDHQLIGCEIFPRFKWDYFMCASKQTDMTLLFALRFQKIG